MNNLPLNFLWIFVVIVFLVLTTLVILYLDTNHKCNVPIESVPNISDNLCCFVGTTITASRYVPELNMVVNPVAIPYLPVCQGFCTNGVLADGVTCVSGIGQDEFNLCMIRSAPVDCDALSLPVAYAGLTPYYPFAATEASCERKGLC
jgi:hypothetical protein